MTVDRTSNLAKHEGPELTNAPAAQSKMSSALGLAAGLGVLVLIVLMPMWLEFSDDCPQRLPCVLQGLPQGHDVAFHAVVARSAARSLMATDPASVLRGNLPYPTWVDSIQGSLGGPVFLIYPPVASFTSAVLESVGGLEITTALRGSASIGVMLALLSFYCAARWSGFASRASAIAAVAYALAPFPIIDLHQRFALATVWAYAWLPLIAVGFWRVARKPDRAAWLVLALSSSALLMTHVITCVLLAAAGVVWGLWTLKEAQPSLRTTNIQSNPALRLAAAGVLALGVAAVFVIPMLAARNQVMLEFIRESSHGAYRRNFLFFNEVANGYSMAVIKDLVQRASVVQLLSGFALIAVWRVSVDRPDRRMLVALVSLVWVFLLQTSVTAPIWAATPLSWAQFPWRLGTLQTLQVALLVLVVLSIATRPERRWWRGSVCAAVLIANVVVALPAFESDGFIFRGGATEIDARAHELWVPEYLPAAWRSRELPLPGELIESELSGGFVVESQIEPSTQRFKVRVPVDSTFHGPLFFPGWTATVDGALQPVTASSDGRISVPIPRGSSEVVLLYRAPWRRVGWAVSLGSLLLLWPVARWVNRPAEEPSSG